MKIITALEFTVLNRFCKCWNKYLEALNKKNSKWYFWNTVTCILYHWIKFLFMLHSFYVILNNTFSQNLQKCSITSNFLNVQIWSTKLHCTTGSVTSSGRSCSLKNQWNKLNLFHRETWDIKDIHHMVRKMHVMQHCIKKVQMYSPLGFEQNYL